MMWRQPSASFKLYLLFLLVACIVCAARVIRIWWIAPPFMLSRRSESTSYLRLLQKASNSTKQWITLTFLVWGIFMAITLYDVCTRLLGEKVIGSCDLVIVFADYSAILMLTLFAVLILFVARWHMLKRIDFLGNQ